MKRFDYRNLFEQNVTVITAHSGCEGTRPNSREHIRAAIDSGAEMIEIDVRQGDGFLYLSHDLPEHPENCVRLEECFALVREAENLCMNLDVKTEGLLPPVLDLAEQYGLCERIVFTGACNDCRAVANARNAEMWRSMWDGDDVAAGIAANAADGSPLLNVHYPMIIPEYDAKLREIGGGFSAWTVDDEESIRRFLTMGIRNITTRKPVLAMALRRELQPRVREL